MHRWGDDTFDWAGLDNAIDLIVKRLNGARIPIRQYKEKWGTLRIYCSLGWSCLHDVTYPGYARYRYPKWLTHLDIFYFPKIFKFINLIILPIHKKIYRAAYKEAVDKYPHLEDEICCCADFRELLDFYKTGEE